MMDAGPVDAADSKSLEDTAGEAVTTDVGSVWVGSDAMSGGTSDADAEGMEIA